MAKQIWKSTVSHSRNIYFIDNEGAREGLIGGFSSSWAARDLTLLAKLADVSACAVDWYARVPSAANYGDGPSRLDFTEVVAIGAEQITVVCPDVAQLCGLDVLSRLSKSR